MRRGKLNKRSDLLTKSASQVSISDQSATALLKASENWTRVSRSRILVRSRQARIFIVRSILCSLISIINLLLDGLVCSTVGYFTRLFYFEFEIQCD